MSYVRLSPNQQILKVFTWSFWAFRPDLGLIEVNQQRVKVETVWHDKVSDVVPSDRHVVQRYGVFAFQNKLDLFQMCVHSNINSCNDTVL